MSIRNIASFSIHFCASTSGTSTLLFSSPAGSPTNSAQRRRRPILESQNMGNQGNEVIVRVAGRRAYGKRSAVGKR